MDNTMPDDVKATLVHLKRYWDAMPKREKTPNREAAAAAAAISSEGRRIFSERAMISAKQAEFAERGITLTLPSAPDAFTPDETLIQSHTTAMAKVLGQSPDSELIQEIERNARTENGLAVLNQLKAIDDKALLDSVLKKVVRQHARNSEPNAFSR